MKSCPEFILPMGTEIVIDAKLDPTNVRGIFVESKYIDARRSAAKAVLGNIVGGHGGDIYWAKHEDGTVAVYCWSEFELT